MWEFFGEDNVLYGADYPFGPEKGEYRTETITDAIDDLAIPEEHKRKIYSENIRSLLDLWCELHTVRPDKEPPLIAVDRRWETNGFYSRSINP